VAIANRGGASVTPIHTTKAEAVAEWIRGRILSGELDAGAALQQEEIARALDVSSTPVREAFLILEAEGWVERRPHRGVVVVEPPLDEVEELREVRNAIERVAVERICRSSDPAVLAPLREAIAETSRARETNDPALLQLSGYHFHHALAVASGSRTIADVSAMLISRARRYLRVNTTIAQSTHEQHADIVRALEARDAAKALEMLRAHETLFRRTVDLAREEEHARRGRAQSR
jgi:DNA-binding GntR family transcriptional regulator